MGLEVFEPRALSLAVISGTCARHELALVALCDFLGPEECSVVWAEPGVLRGALSVGALFGLLRIAGTRRP